eukprot:3180541-Amphidinium_carterae.2
MITVVHFVRTRSLKTYSSKLRVSVRLFTTESTELSYALGAFETLPRACSRCLKNDNLTDRSNRIIISYHSSSVDKTPAVF